MIILYTPEGGETQHLDAGRLRASEIQIIERTADARWQDVQQGMKNGDINAVRSVAFVIKKRTEPSLRLAAFDPFEDEVQVKLDLRETRGYIQWALGRYASDPEGLEGAYEEIRDASIDPDAFDKILTEETAPKDPAPQPEPEPTPASASE
ncbi:hypothetical protein ABZ890_08370 [Streptomyces sp. NPDC046984]|uniref:hypothetical protein n=1 Tax=Streptomyces sp. NPDC046984 TaxID=3155138 RepID=UPI0034010151